MSAELQSVKQRFGIVGNSLGLNRALDVALKVAPTNLTVLISGESGVGKENFSQIIHAYSPRKHEAFIAVNCGAIPEGTIDSELFGHEKGSFTGAQEKRKGYFETVNKGTIFLDEIGEMPMPTQSRLLRVLESGEFMKVGSSVSQKTDVRVIAATNVNLQSAIQKGKFREDLYYRLNTIPIEIPPLRERGEDIIMLFRKFMVDFGERNHVQPPKLDETARELLLRYPWPGNVRQLKNTAEQLCILSTKEFVTAADLELILPDKSMTGIPVSAGGASSFGEGFERELLYKMLFEIRNDMAAVKTFLFNLSGGTTFGNAGFTGAPVYSDLPVLPGAKHTNGSHDRDTTFQPTVTMDDEHFETAETVEETLSIADKEKELILKALKKHRNKRKDAAGDLGISERTLYRKIKEYDIQE